MKSNAFLHPFTLYFSRLLEQSCIWIHWRKWHPMHLRLVGIRMVALYFGVNLGGRAVSASKPMRRFAWMGFISQAGVALTLAELARAIPDPAVHAGAGDTFATLVIAGIAIHEVVGPVLLKVGLGLSGELPKGTSVPTAIPPDDEESDQFAELADPETDLTDIVTMEDALDVTLDTLSPRLNELAQELSADLQVVIRSFLDDHVTGRIEHQQQLLKEVRREFLRYHRRLSITADNHPTDLIPEFRKEQVDASERWRQFVLRQQFEFKQRSWSPMTLVEHLDSIVETVPESVKAPVEERSYRQNGEESPFWQALRLFLRLRHRLSKLFGLPNRHVQYRNIARYHFSGHAAGRLESVAALLVANERHLISSTRSLFEHMMSETDTLLEQNLGDKDTLKNALRSFRHQIEDEYALAEAEVARTATDAVKRLGRVLGRLQSEFHNDLYTIGTIDLANRTRRYSRAFRARNRGIYVLEHTYPAAREQIGHGLQTLALELELLGFEGYARGALRQYAEPLSRRIQGRGHTQLTRVLEHTGQCLDTLAKVLAEENQTPEEMIQAIREATEPLHHVTVDALEATDSLVFELRSDRPPYAIVACTHRRGRGTHRGLRCAHGWPRTIR